ncbi:MAG: metallophosphoesterase family protein, partial [candidate division Zixibacteria bacterium]|nr:metallophosphoesterase family protein [candidate division Zixibacteria bacterium]
MKIGLICDIHEDLHSLKEALRQLEKRNCDDLICLGDIVGYDISCHEHGATRDSSACIAAIRSNCRYAVIGNHDLFALKKIPQST